MRIILKKPKKKVYNEYFFSFNFFFSALAYSIAIFIAIILTFDIKNSFVTQKQTFAEFNMSFQDKYWGRFMVN